MAQISPACFKFLPSSVKAPAQTQLRLSLALFFISPAAPPNHPPMEVYSPAHHSFICKLCIVGSPSISWLCQYELASKQTASSSWAKLGTAQPQVVTWQYHLSISETHYDRDFSPLISDRNNSFFHNLRMDISFQKKKLRDIQQERKDELSNKIWIVLIYFELNLTIFFIYLGLSQSLLVYIGLSRSLLVYLYLSWSILGYLCLSWDIYGQYGYLRLSLAISSYLWLSLAISGYIGHFRVILGYIWLSRAISGYLSLTLAILEYFGVPLALSGKCVGTSRSFLYFVIFCVKSINQ